MEKDIEILKEVVHVKAKPRQSTDTTEDCSNFGCANKIKTHEEQIQRLLCDQQQSKTELLDVFRAKEKYKRLFKQVKQENEQLKSELFYYKSRERLEPDLRAHQGDQNHLAAERNEFKCFVLTSPKQEINDLPSSFSYEEPQASNEKEDYTLEIDEKCFQGIYTPQIAHILEIRFQESSILSKETMEECCRLTNLTKPQVIRWFHMRRPENKRSRRFNANILSHLRQFYVHNQFPSKAERAVLAHKTNLSNVQVRSWFKNKERGKKSKICSKSQL
uniref:Homeobox domain-containing protein n=1 Tax=Ditylenchus dipsaci TaxID=166011 RepID=A0A915EDF6_9BILA